MKQKARTPEETTLAERKAIRDLTAIIEGQMAEHRVPQPFQLDIYMTLLVGSLLQQREDDEKRGPDSELEPLFPLNVNLIIDVLTMIRDAKDAKEAGELLAAKNMA